MRRFVQALGVLVLLFSSCSFSRVLIVADPYIEPVFDGRWPPLGWKFALRALGSAHRVIPLRIDSDDPRDFTITVDRTPNIIVMSAGSALATLHESLAEVPTIVVDGPETDEDSRISLRIDRSSAMEEVGRMAADFAVERGGTVLLLYPSQRKGPSDEFDALADAFNAHIADLNSDTIPQGLKLTRVASRPTATKLPSSFTAAAPEASLLLLFAGPLNMTALNETADAGTPVITEYMRGSDAWSDRIVASVEEDTEQMLDELMRILVSDTRQIQYYYPAMLLNSEKWFDAIAPSNL